MDKNSFYISVGIWIVVLQFMGVPSTWKTALTIFSALIVILINLSPIILKKVQNKTPRTRKKVSTTANTNSAINIIGNTREASGAKESDQAEDKPTQGLHFSD